MNVLLKLRICLPLIKKFIAGAVQNDVLDFFSIKKVFKDIDKNWKTKLLHYEMEMLLCLFSNFWDSGKIVHTETEDHFAYVGFSVKKVKSFYKHLIKWASSLVHGLSVEAAFLASE